MLDVLIDETDEEGFQTVLEDQGETDESFFTTASVVQEMAEMAENQPSISMTTLPSTSSLPSDKSETKG
jgi:hypothetical protein